jgi:hypothetical protein
MKGAARRVFLSYAAGDKRTARQLAEGLRGQSFDVWTADSDLSPGDNWAAQMAGALGQSDAMVVLLSAESVESEWVRRDVEYALSTKRFEHRLIPVVIGEQRPEWLDKAPWVLKRLQMISSPNATKASREIADALRSAG